MKLTPYIFFLFFGLSISYSQTHIYQHFGVDEGLPSSEVYDIYQDKQGYIWFATDKGLSRYNGYEFENFTTKDGLPGNTILDFYPQENGEIWCYEYHTQSLFYFNEVFNGFKKYKFNNLLKEKLNARSTVKSLVIDKNNTLQVGGYAVLGVVEITEKGEVSRFFDKNSSETYKDINMGIDLKNGGFFSLYHNYKREKETLFFNSTFSPGSAMDVVFLNKNQTVFIDRKLGIVSNDDKVIYLKTEQNPIGIRHINDSQFFVGYYSNGAEIRDVLGTIYETFLPNKSVSNFLIDKEGGYWFSTLDDGVYYIKHPKIKKYTEEHISSLVKDSKGVLFAGLDNSNIARIKSNIEILYEGIKTGAALVSYDIINDKIYGYSGKLIDFSSKEKKTNIVGANKLPENIGNPYLASAAHYYSKIDNNKIVEYKSDVKIQDICNFQNILFIGTSTGLFIQQNDSIKAFQPKSILKSRIDDIDVTKNTAYMATQGNGVVVYNDSIYSITTKDKLTNNIVSEVHIENDSTVWACTNTGLNRIDFKSSNIYEITTITKEDGLLSNDINDIEIINDTVWVATKKGLCFFKKEVLEENKKATILSLSIEKITVNNKKVDKKNLRLKYNQNNISFNLQAISHKHTSNIIYYYRLKEIDTAWSITKNRAINFSSLSPDNYTFEAKAYILNNPNDFTVSHSFKIQSPFWKSWWFYTLCSLLFASLVYLFFKIRVLTYNKDVFRELIRLLIKRLKRKEQIYKFRANGEDFKIPTHEIQYINSQGNYLDIITDKKNYTIRCKIGNFINTTPDSLEYLRVHRSYIIRIDQVTSKGKNWVMIKENKIPVGETYLKELEKIQF